VIHRATQVELPPADTGYAVHARDNARAAIRQAETAAERCRYLAERYGAPKPVAVVTAGTRAGRRSA